MKKIKTVLDMINLAGLEKIEKKDYVRTVDNKGMSKWESKFLGQYTITNTFSQEGELLGRNTDKPIEFAYSSGPIILFAFKIKGGFAMFKINVIQVSTFSARPLERIYQLPHFLKQIKQLRECAINKLDISTTDFNTHLICEELK